MPQFDSESNISPKFNFEKFLCIYTWQLQFELTTYHLSLFQWL